MNKFSFHSLILVFLLPVVNINSQVIQIRSFIDNDSLMIGEQTYFTFSLIKDKSAKVTFPVISDSLTGNVDILQISDIDSLARGKELTLTRKYLITSFDTGKYVIPGFPFTVEFGDIRDTIYSRPAYLYVQMPVVDLEAGFRDIKEPVNTPLNFREILPFAAVSLLGLGLIYLIWLIIRKLLSKEKKEISAKETVPPHIIAMQELQKMLLDKSWERLKVKEFYTRLSGIVRIYIEDQFGVPALETTTPEIIKAFESNVSKNNDIILKLEELLQLSDLVKFAREAPLPYENKQNIDKAIIFVEMTKPSYNDLNKDNRVDKELIAV